MDDLVDKNSLRSRYQLKYNEFFKARDDYKKAREKKSAALGGGDIVVFLIFSFISMLLAVLIGYFISSRLPMIIAIFKCPPWKCDYSVDDYIYLVFCIMALSAFLFFIIFSIYFCFSAVKKKYSLSAIKKQTLKDCAEKTIIPPFINKFICSNCLKPVFIEKMEFPCPFCEANYSGETSYLEKILFDSCTECEGKIQHIKCYNCNEWINLFAPYNEEELIRKRYV